MGSKVSELFNVRDLAVIVTGGASGIGLAFAEALVGNGARVTILDINVEAMKREVTRLASLGEVRGERVDISDRASINSAVANAVEAFGGLDVLFANAGTEAGSGFLNLSGERVPESQVENFDDDNWDKVIATNLTGVMSTVKSAVPAMKKRGSGRIIITTSTAGFTVNAVASLGYYPAKAGAAHLTRRLALELARFNILVNSVAPGGVSTNIAGGLMKNPQFRAIASQMIPTHRLGEPEDFHGIALFLASQASRYITGTEFVIDGGATLGVAD